MLSRMTFYINFQHNTSCLNAFPYYTNSKVVCQLFKGHLFKLRTCLKETVLFSNLKELLSKGFILLMSWVAFSCLPDLLDSCRVRNVSFLCTSLSEKKKWDKGTPLHMIYFKAHMELHNNSMLSLWLDAV